MIAKKYITINEAMYFSGLNYEELNEYVKSGRLKAAKRKSDGEKVIFTKEFISILKELDKYIPAQLDIEHTRVLIVDDDAPMANAIKRQLAIHDNLKVQTVVNGYELGYALESFRPNIISLDYNMPGLNGLEILEKIREEKDTRDTFVIIYSGMVTSMVELEMRELGVSAVIHKGQDPTILENEILKLAEEINELE